MTDIEKYQDFSFEELVDDNFFIKWVTQPTAASDRFWNHFLEFCPHMRETVEEARIFLESMYEIHRRTNFDNEILTQKANKLLDESRQQSPVVTPPSSQHNTSPHVSSKRTIWWSMAASILLVAGMAVFWMSERLEPTYQVIRTDFGEWKTIELPDGSVVELNANSELKTLRNWEEGELRRVWLKGEAFFEVQKKPEKHVKFEVTTEDLTVSVFGTAFNVRNRNNQTTVYLEEGKIELAIEQDSETKSLDMIPGERISYSKKKGLPLERAKDTSMKNITWKDGTLMFEQTPLPIALQQIAEIYDVIFELKTKDLNQYLVNGGVPIKNFKIMRQTFEEIYGFEFNRDGKKIYISADNFNMKSNAADAIIK